MATATALALFATGANDVPSNFIGPVGAFLAELSFQVMGFASYLLPGLVAAAGWHYFWCRSVDALYTKVTGLVLLLEHSRFSGRICGNSSTSCMEALLVSSMQSRSIPKPMPDVGGIPYSRARRKS